MDRGVRLANNTHNLVAVQMQFRPTAHTRTHVTIIRYHSNDVVSFMNDYYQRRYAASCRSPALVELFYLHHNLITLIHRIKRLYSQKVKHILKASRCAARSILNNTTLSGVSVCIIAPN